MKTNVEVMNLRGEIREHNAAFAAYCKDLMPHFDRMCEDIADCRDPRRRQYLLQDLAHKMTDFHRSLGLRRIAAASQLEAIKRLMLDAGEVSK